MLKKLKLKITENSGNSDNSEDADKLLKKMLKIYEDIFKKNLSDYSINVFKILYYDIKKKIIKAASINVVNRFNSMILVSAIYNLK